MSLPLKDLRTAVPEEVDAVLEAYARASERDKSALVREILQSWANERLREHELVTRLLKEPRR